MQNLYDKERFSLFHIILAKKFIFLFLYHIKLFLIKSQNKIEILYTKNWDVLKITGANEIILYWLISRVLQ